MSYVKPCVKCGGTRRYRPRKGRRVGQCVDCKKANGAAWRKANPEKEKARSAAWWTANPEKEKAKSSARYKANPEKEKAKSAAWRKANPDKSRAISSRMTDRRRRRILAADPLAADDPKSKEDTT
jgi:hypothetical protein